jgi:homocysteine S-methyltransferase
VTILTATHPGEPIGVVRAATAVGIPVVIAFTVETDGRLPNGQVLHEAIEEVDAATERAAIHFGINCAHPDHFAAPLEVASPAIGRIELLRANASRASHAELDEADELDDGDPLELGCSLRRTGALTSAPASPRRLLRDRRSACRSNRSRLRTTSALTDQDEAALVLVCSV